MIDSQESGRPPADVIQVSEKDLKLGSEEKIALMDRAEAIRKLEVLESDYRDMAGVVKRIKESLDRGKDVPSDDKGFGEKLGEIYTAMNEQRANIYELERIAPKAVGAPETIIVEV